MTEGNAERRAPVPVVFRREPALVGGDDRLGNCQAHAQAARLGGEERVEDALEVLLGNAGVRQEFSFWKTLSGTLPQTLSVLALFDKVCDEVCDKGRPSRAK